MSACRIRPLRAADAPAVALLSGELGYPATAGQIADRLAALAASPDHQVFGAEREGDGLVGWLHVFQTMRVESGPFAEVGGFIVAFGQRGQGIGRQLLTAAERWAADQGCPCLRVRTRTDRADAPAIYQRLGFTTTKVQNVLDKIPARDS